MHRIILDYPLVRASRYFAFYNLRKGGTKTGKRKTVKNEPRVT